MADFQPRFLFADEITQFDLPSIGQLPNIMNLVDAASSLIDEECGRVDVKGVGSLVYTTYAERILIPEGRNLFRVAFAPMTAPDATVVADLTTLNNVSGSNYYNGFIPSSIVQKAGNLSSIIGLSGRYSYGRRSTSAMFPDSQYGANILQIAAFFGGPPQFTPIDISQSDYYDDVGEVWCPAGLMMSSYTEILIQYNSGYDPRHMPRNIKHATAALVKNFIARGGGITSVIGYSAAKVHVQFTRELIDPTIERFLTPFRKTVCM